jgi:hypothetical protein
MLAALSGVAFGRLWDRWVRQRGDVHCQIGYSTNSHDSQIIDPSPFKVSRRVGVHFFNDKEVDTGLSALTVVFVCESGEEVALGPETRDYDTDTRPRGVINLPSKTWVTVEVRGAFYGPDAQRIRPNPKAVEVKGKFPDGKPHHKNCERQLAPP